MRTFFLRKSLIFTSTISVLYRKRPYVVINIPSMNKALFLLLSALIGFGFTTSEDFKYSIEQGKIDTYRKQPVTDKMLIEAIRLSDEFIHIEKNSAISEATLEHHLMNKFSRNGITTFIVFEYFSLEGVTCSINAVSFDAQNKLVSILRLANYEEYPDGSLAESTIVKNDFAERITVVKGLKEYVDSLDLFIMKIDSTIVSFKLNDYKKIEVVDSVEIHYEYLN